MRDGSNRESLGKCPINRWLSAHRLIFSVSLCICGLILLSSCSEFEKPAPEPYFAEAKPPARQEFRWSNGKLPKSFDPARASAPPETDVVRALFEGLTETDPNTLQDIPGVAEKWSSSDDFKIWTFELRKDARWSNGKQVTANDFVRSWKRLAEMGGKAAHKQLLNNIAGLPLSPAISESPSSESDLPLNSVTNPDLPLVREPASNRPTSMTGNRDVQPDREGSANAAPQLPRSNGDESESKLGFAAESELILKVTLDLPDKDFPKLVSNPIFRPVYGDGGEFEGEKLNEAIVTNGAFQIFSIGEGGITLDRSENYWNRDAVKLERVRFVPMESAERALAAYRAGELDAVTNAEFAPLALKLLSPYEDFKRTTHGALNFYEVNSTIPPFSDRRVRQALSNAIEREGLTEGEMEGVTRPALSFLPFGTKTKTPLSQDKEKARELLDDAGFPAGDNFPVIRLLVNRNQTQQRIARSVARMWKQNLNLDTEIIVKDADELELARRAGDFDLVRRGVVLATADETVNFMSIFETGTESGDLPDNSIGENQGTLDNKVGASGTNSNSASNAKGPIVDTGLADAPGSEMILTEESAMFELRAIPLYFPTSYSLVKPYVSGFEMNSLDALSLSNVLIDNNWQP